MNRKRMICLLTACTALAAAFSGCSSPSTAPGNEVNLTLSGSYPIETDQTLRHWVRFSSTTASNKDELEISKWLEEATGVKVEYEHPTTSSATEAFNIMIASDDMPDIITCGWQNTNGGGANNIDTGVVTDLTPWFEAGAAPNLQKVIDSMPEAKKQMTDIEGRYYSFPMILGGDVLKSFMTFFIREDLLETAGLETPETLEEWEAALTAFKDMGIQTPILLKLSNYWQAYFKPFAACFDFSLSFYRDGDRIRCGYSDREKYSEWVKAMARWYEKGLIDVDFSDESDARWDSIITNGNNGAYYGAISTYKKYKEAISDDSIRYTPTKIPAFKKGERPYISQSQNTVNNYSAAVSATSRNKELAIRYLDYGYSEEGQVLQNFGKEGVSFTYQQDKNGVKVPIYTDIITDPEKRNGLNFGQALSLYTNVSTPISIQSPYYIFQNYDLEKQHEALGYANDTNSDDHGLPGDMFTMEQQQLLSDLVTPIDTYREETIAKIIAGKLPISELDNYFNQLEKMGIDKIVQIYQEAYNNYLKK